MWEVKLIWRLNSAEMAMLLLQPEVGQALGLNAANGKCDKLAALPTQYQSLQRILRRNQGRVECCTSMHIRGRTESNAVAYEM